MCTHMHVCVWLYIPLIFTYVHVQVFGLGNKTYEHYNLFSRYVDKRLEELGAERICERGEGDDDGKWVIYIRMCEAIT